MKLAPLITVALGMLAFAAPQGEPNVESAQNAVSNDFTTASDADPGQDLSNVEDKDDLVHAEYEMYSKRRMLAKGLIDVLAQVFKAQTEVPENCLDKVVTTNDGQGKIRIYHCQAGEYVSVSASGGKSPIRLQMKLNFNTATRGQDKTYKCGRGDINRRLSEEFNRWVPNLIRDFDPEYPAKTVLPHCFDGPPWFCC